MTELEREEFLLLIENSMRGELAAGDLQRLEKCLEDHSHLKLYVEYVLQTVALGVWASSVHEFGLPSSPKVAEQPETSEAEFASSRDRSETLVTRSRALRFWPLSRRDTSLLTLAATVFVVAGVWYWQQNSEILPERVRQPVGTVSVAQGSKWRTGFSTENGASVIEGQALELLEGRAQIGLSSGVNLVVKAPCSLVLNSPKEVFLRDGVLSVQVADWAEGFLIATSSVQVVDLGKQFVVSANAKTGAVEAHAIDGKLRVQAASAPDQRVRGTLVSSGEAIRVLSTGDVSSPFKANRKLFDQSVDELRPFKPLSIFNTGHALRVGDEDSHWRIVAATEGFVTDKYAVVCEPYKSYYLANEPDVSQWISVSTPPYEDCPPNAMYTFETDFDLTGYDLSTVTIVGQVMADNGVTAVRINGQHVSIKPWLNTAKGTIYNVFHPIEIPPGFFVEGKNTIQFDVWNAVNEVHPHALNPMALRVEWQAFGRLLPGFLTNHLPGPRQRTVDYRQQPRRFPVALQAGADRFGHVIRDEGQTVYH